MWLGGGGQAIKCLCKIVEILPTWKWHSQKPVFKFIQSRVSNNWDDSLKYENNLKYEDYEKYGVDFK